MSYARKPSRRDLLRAAGGAATLFPFLGEVRRAQGAQPPTPRLILLMQTNGTNQSNFWPLPPVPVMPAPVMPAPPMMPGAPALPLHSPILAELAKDPVLAPRTTLIKGLLNDVGGAGNGHDHGFAGLYSGYASVGKFSDPWGNGISLDRTLRNTLTFHEPFKTLHCGVLASDTPPFKKHRTSFSYDGPGYKSQKPTELDPYRLYARYFPVGPRPAPGVDPVAAAKHRLARRTSVLDAVTADIDGLLPRLPASERMRLSGHAHMVRVFELQLGATITPDPDRPPRCVDVAGPPLPDEGLDVRQEDNVPLLIDLMFDFIAVALSCQLVRVVSFQFGNGGEKWYYRWLGINQNSHDDIAHNDKGTDPVITDKVVRINQWYTQKVMRLCGALAAVPEAGGTLLDNSLVVWGNELATGPHGMNDIPVALIGGAAGRLRAGNRVVDAGLQDYRRLGTSLLNVMGLPAQGFGEAPACGPVVGL
jgi:hypothetical protein